MNSQTRKARRVLLTTFFAATFATSAVFTGGCRKEEAPEATKPAEVPKAMTAEEKAEVVRKLAEADAIDGETDKVVSKCAMCALRMDGAAEHAYKIEGYTMHFCSADCLGRCKKDPAKTLMAMKIPEE